MQGWELFTGNQVTIFTLVDVLFESVSYCAVLGLLVARYREIKLKKKQVASNECVYRGNVPFLWLSTISSKLIPTTAYKTFLFVSDSN